MRSGSCFSGGNLSFSCSCNFCLKVVGAAVTYFYGVFIEDFVVAVFVWEMLADQVQKFSPDVCLHVHAVGWIKLNDISLPVLAAIL